jgi:hypothetical protein
VLYQLTDEIKAKLEIEIDAFSTAIKDYDYSQLRADSKSKEVENRAVASVKGINNLLDIFKEKFLSSDDEAIRESFSNIKDWSEKDKPLVIKLLDALLMFKNKITESDKVYFLKRKYDDKFFKPEDFNLSEGSAWVSIFQYTI